MKAWLITWNWAGDHAAVDDPIVAVLSSRLGSEEVRKYVERCYIEHTASLDEKVAYARYNRQEPPPYPAEFAHVPARAIAMASDEPAIPPPTIAKSQYLVMVTIAIAKLFNQSMTPSCTVQHGRPANPFRPYALTNTIFRHVGEVKLGKFQPSGPSALNVRFRAGSRHPMSANPYCPCGRLLSRAKRTFGVVPGNGRF